MINIQTIIDGLEMVDDMNRVFLDTETDETVYLSEFDPDLTSDTAELMEEYPDRFIPLPSQREINEYGMMEDFIDELPDGNQKDTLSMAISGRGAFRRFKDTVARFDLEESWYAFRDKQYARVARHWCEENDVEYYQKGSGVPLAELLEDIADDEDSPMNVVKINKEDLSTTVGLQNMVKGLFADSGIDIKAEEEDEEHIYSITPTHLIKYHDIFKRLSALQGEIEDLADEVGGPVGDALDDASSDIENALDRLDEDVNVEVVVDGKVYGGIEVLTELLKRIRTDPIS